MSNNPDYPNHPNRNRDAGASRAAAAPGHAGPLLWKPGMRTAPLTVATTHAERAAYQSAPGNQPQGQRLAAYAHQSHHAAAYPVEHHQPAQAQGYPSYQPYQPQPSHHNPSHSTLSRGLPGPLILPPPASHAYSHHAAAPSTAPQTQPGKKRSMFFVGSPGTDKPSSGSSSAQPMSSNPHSRSDSGSGYGSNKSDAGSGYPERSSSSESGYRADRSRSASGGTQNS